MEYAFTVYDSITDVPADAWTPLRTQGDLATDPRLIRCIEEGLAGQARCWTAVARDETGSTVAGACLALFRVDAAETTGPMTRRATAAVRRVFPNALKFGVLFCGLPAPSGDGQLRILPGADAQPMLDGLGRAMRDLARRHRAGMLVIKELNEAEASEIHDVRFLGYVRGDVPPDYLLERSVADFDAYRGQLRTDYRRRILHSIKKFADAGFRVDYLHGEELAAQYTDEYHRLYEAVLARADYRLEHWPADFFRNIAKRFGHQASMTRITTDDGRVVAWSFGITDDGIYHNLYGGIDYALNPRFDLYFNLCFQDMDRAFRSGARALNLGQTADWFKARLGAVPSPRYFFARGVSPWVQLGLKVGRRWAFPPVPAQSVQHVFRTAPLDGPPPGRDNAERRSPEPTPDIRPRSSPQTPPRPDGRKA